MNKPTLVILAAGMASRYGGNKQIDGFGPNGETILEYSIYDAIEAGFGKVCFIIRPEHQEIFENNIAYKISPYAEVSYAYQTTDLSEYGFTDTIERAKPWGTGHALLSAKDKVSENFCVINADDFYSAKAFIAMHKFLTEEVEDNYFSLLGYTIGKTLSDSGPVTRGVCATTDEDDLKQLDERAKVFRDETGAIRYEQGDGSLGTLAEDEVVSMNFWGFTPAIFSLLEPMFVDFVSKNKQNPKSEFLIPEAAQDILKAGKANFKVIRVNAPCFGVTYQEDKALVKESLAQLTREGVYPDKLWTKAINQ
ncbi:sugar phosphate nucleotidyltransferase [Olivibacter sitiensis]|uniref:sugar phosphate nucleotidyltransferase n=1 Tax=Olivibacter sitiensis TaxID=376470 RepID=UPI0003FD2FF5|nr:sugar phosphate nucleotidyltransferase [Olivibacter sitiensis]